MITLNNKLFAKDEAEFIDSLFTHKKTCVGYYKIFKNSIHLYDHNKQKIGAITKHKCLVSAIKQDTGHYFYNHGDIELVGSYDNYKQKCEEIQTIVYNYLNN